MKKRGEILVIIPARGGSKEIKNKNIMLVNDKPLIYYTIKPALEAKEKGMVDEVFVSTDSVKIAAVAKNLGVNTPFLRPKKISGDKAKSIDLVIHALDSFSRIGKTFSWVMLLLPTSPLRTLEDLRNSIRLIEKYPNKQSLISCYKDESINDTIMYKAQNLKVVALSSFHNKGQRRQDREPIYIRNGAIYLSKVKFILKNKLIFENKPLLYEMPKNRSINIDAYDDLKLFSNIICK